MPTKTMEVMRLPAQGNKMVLDSVLTTHERVVQVGTLGDPQVLLLLWFPPSLFLSICPTFFPHVLPALKRWCTPELGS